ncbi:MAG: hypothetical protein IT270_05835, partial [Saprospiraceae bacterium]|nr:hypothetical protein [Saprospiraceae bacterium]
AKKLERNVMDVDEIRKNNPSELMERIRKDAYAVVDLLLDAATMVMHQVETLTENLNKTQAATTPAPAATPAPASFIPVLKNDLPAAPGSTVEIPMLLQNHDVANPSTVLLSKPDLKDHQGNTIVARNIRIKPETADLKANGTQPVSIHVKIPKTTPAGVYSGLFQDQNNASTSAVLILTVA